MTARADRRRLGLVLAVPALLAAATPVAGGAQRSRAVPSGASQVARADALLRAGRVEAAEAIYYREARRRPRDPVARLALGRYLAARGATRVGAVLIEEARFFGANPTVAALHLAPLYARLGDYKALALLPAAPLSAAERARAEWLAKNPPVIAGPESLSVALAPPEGDSPSELGTIDLVVGRDTVVAQIDGAVQGLVLDTSSARSPWARVFTGDPAEVQAGVPSTPAVVYRARLGALTFTNLATSLEPLGGPRRARIGLDLLGRFSPTLDPKAQRLVLRRSGRIARRLAGERVPLLLEPRDAWVVWQGRPEALGAPVVMHRLRGWRWTLDWKRGEIVLQS